MKTALEKIIEKIEEARENFPKEGFTDKYLEGLKTGFQLSIFIIKQVGTVLEREQIEKAFNDGIYLSSPQSEFKGVGNNYYQEVYKDNSGTGKE